MIWQAEVDGATPSASLEAVRSFSDTSYPVGFLDYRCCCSTLPIFFPHQILVYILNGAVFAERTGWYLGFVGAQGLAITSAGGACSAFSAVLQALPVLGSGQGEWVELPALTGDRANSPWVLRPGGEPRGSGKVSEQMSVPE